jgi:primosomal replication protein N
VKRNEVVIDGRVLKRKALRYTPAGIPVIELRVGHSSMQSEAGGRREARCEIDAIAIGEMAVEVAALKLDRPLRFGGFLAQRSVKDNRPVLHLQSVQAGDGNE